MKKIILLPIVALMCSISVIANPLVLKRRAMYQHGGMRMPSIERVSADYEKGLITIGVKGYTGGIQVFIYDSQGNIIGYTISSIAKEGAVSLNLDILNEGGYSLKIVLDNATYYGKFYV